MSISNIEWTDRTWNPTAGCDIVSKECLNCYAMKMAWRLQSNPRVAHRYAGTAKKLESGTRTWTGKINMLEEVLKYPLSIRKPQKFFVDSMSDLFHKDVTIEFIAKVYAMMFLVEWHTYQVLTKRPERRLEVFKSEEFMIYLHKWINEYQLQFEAKLGGELQFRIEDIKAWFPFSNVWEGTSVGIIEAKPRIDFLRNTPAAYRFISAEPMLEDLGELDLTGINQIIVGGESGGGKRPFDCDWARSIRDQAKEQRTAFYMKQVDKVQEIPEDLFIREF